MNITLFSASLTLHCPVKYSENKMLSKKDFNDCMLKKKKKMFFSFLSMNCESIL